LLQEVKRYYLLIDQDTLGSQPLDSGSWFAFQIPKESDIFYYKLQQTKTRGECRKIWPQKLTRGRSGQRC
jgi:hypothetical protein